jgi:Fe-S oxidoreductase
METGANLVATGCPGCRLQIHGDLEEESIEEVHPIELLAMATIRSKKKDKFQ